MALAQMEPAIATAESLSAVTSSGSESLAERVLIGVIAVLAAVLVPGHAERLTDTPLSWADLVCALRPQRPSHPSPSVTHWSAPPRRGVPSRQSALKADGYMA